MGNSKIPPLNPKPFQYHPPIRLFHSSDLLLGTCKLPLGLVKPQQERLLLGSWLLAHLTCSAICSDRDARSRDLTGVRAV